MADQFAENLYAIASSKLQAWPGNWRVDLSIKSSLPLSGSGVIVWSCTALEFLRLSGGQIPFEPQTKLLRYHPV